MDNCKLCGTPHNPKEACDVDELINKCHEYRQMLEDICNGAVYEPGGEDEEALVKVDTIEKARVLLGWKR